jgi:type VI secretion system protein ImpG
MLFESFDHSTLPEGSSEAQTGGFYRVHRRPAIGRSGVETFISFPADPGRRGPSRDEVISLELTCSNGHLADGLPPARIRFATGNSPEFASYRNLSVATESAAPPLSDSLDWKAVSNLALNFVGVQDLASLRAVLRTYDFVGLWNRAAERERERRLEGIVDIDHRPRDWLVRGIPLRGMRTTLGVQESNYASEGDMYLFFSVLSAFLAHYASINSFHQLVVEGRESRERYEWPRMAGRERLD